MGERRRRKLNVPNICLNIGTMVGLIVVLVAGGIISTDMYSIVDRLEKQADANGIAVNKTISQLVISQEKANQRGNVTLQALQEVLARQLSNEENIITSLHNETREFITQFNQTNEAQRMNALEPIVTAINNNTELLEQFLKNQSGDLINMTDRNSNQTLDQILEIINNNIK